MTRASGRETHLSTKQHPRFISVKPVHTTATMVSRMYAASMSSATHRSWKRRKHVVARRVRSTAQRQTVRIRARRGKVKASRSRFPCSCRSAPGRSECRRQKRTSRPCSAGDRVGVSAHAEDPSHGRARKSRTRKPVNAMTSAIVHLLRSGQFCGCWGDSVHSFCKSTVGLVIAVSSLLMRSSTTSSCAPIDSDGLCDFEDVVLADVEGVVRRLGGEGSILAQYRLQAKSYSTSASDFISEEKLVEHAKRSANERVRSAVD